MTKIVERKNNIKVAMAKPLMLDIRVREKRRIPVTGARLMYSIATESGQLVFRGPTFDYLVTLSKKKSPAKSCLAHGEAQRLPNSFCL